MLEPQSGVIRFPLPGRADADQAEGERRHLPDLGIGVAEERDERRHTFPQPDTP